MLAASNPRLKRLRRLSRRRSSRREEGAFVIEGPILVADALAAGVHVSEVFHEPGFASESLLAACENRGVPVFEVAPGVLGSTLATSSPPPVAAVAATSVLVSVDAVLDAAVERSAAVLVLVDVSTSATAWASNEASSE